MAQNVTLEAQLIDNAMGSIVTDASSCGATIPAATGTNWNGTTNFVFEGAIGPGNYTLTVTAPYHTTTNPASASFQITVNP